MGEERVEKKGELDLILCSPYFLYERLTYLDRTTDRRPYRHRDDVLFLFETKRTWKWVQKQERKH